MEKSVSDRYVDALERAFREGDARVAEKAAERERVDLVRQIVASLGAGDLDGFARLLDPDFTLEIHAPTFFPWIRRAQGIEAVRAAIAFNFGTVEAQTPEIVSLVAQGDLVDVFLRERGRLRANGLPYEVLGVQQFAFRGSVAIRCVEVLAHRTPED